MGSVLVPQPHRHHPRWQCAFDIPRVSRLSSSTLKMHLSSISSSRYSLPQTSRRLLKNVCLPPLSPLLIIDLYILPSEGWLPSPTAHRSHSRATSVQPRHPPRRAAYRNSKTQLCSSCCSNRLPSLRRTPCQHRRPYSVANTTIGVPVWRPQCIHTAFECRCQYRCT